jgi:hypothetical protein
VLNGHCKQEPRALVTAKMIMKRQQSWEFNPGTFVAEQTKQQPSSHDRKEKKKKFLALSHH